MINKQSTPRVYISGKISNEPTERIKENDQTTSELLEAIGCTPVIPINGELSTNTNWEDYMAQNIKMLCTCDAILMLKSWRESKGAAVERCIAIQKKMPILFEDELNRSNQILSSVKSAVEEVTGLSLQEYATDSRKQNLFFARMLFSYQCHKFGMKLVDIANYINRDHSAITYYIKRYPSEQKYNNQFALMAQRVNELSLCLY